MFILIIMILLLLFILMILCFINLIISFKKYNNREKLSPFECGFDPFTSSRLPFSIQFYSISIIFLIFDIEVIIFLPMISSFLFNNLISWMMTSLIFTIILLFGLYLEWFDGALSWIK